ncbi:MAG: hypothetical protein MR485_04185 [Mollicutes bacterium]|nr:hypothetical protein [Mollicutes bacterium]
MKNKKILKIRNILIKLLVHFTTVFTMLVVAFIGLSSMIGGVELNNLIPWGFIILVSIIESVIFYFVFKLNKISILTQVTLVYFTFIFFLYILGYIFKIFNKNDIPFVILTFVMVLIGYGFISFILLIKNKRETDKLNQELSKFKERDE